MWYLQALGAAVSLALIREFTSSRENAEPLEVSERIRSWGYQDLSRCRSLWMDCLLYARVSQSTRFPDVYLHLRAEAAFSAAWAALDRWNIDAEYKERLDQSLQDTARFLETLKPEQNRPGVTHLANRLRKIFPEGEKRTEIWAYLIGHWLRETAGSCSLSSMEELTELGWPLASFGEGFWSKEPVYYRTDDQLHRLVQPFSRQDAFEAYGPFQPLASPPQEPGGARLAVGSLVPTRGLKVPKIWSLEAMLGGISGVTLTRTGHVHRQFAGKDLPEWFEAVEITYQPRDTPTKEILFRFWQSFSTWGDLLFYSTEEQKHECLQAWSEFRAGHPAWAVPHDLELRPCNWFEPGKAKDQKSALQKMSLLASLCSRLDLTNSHLATKLNAFAAGFGEDEDVVLLAARYGLEDGLTLALRTIRYFSRGVVS